MTNFEPTSRWAILPSGETLDLVSPGISKVVGRWRDAGVEVPESLRLGGLPNVSYITGMKSKVWSSSYIMGLFGAVVNGVSVKAEPFVLPCLAPFWGAVKLPPETGAQNALLNLSFSLNDSISSGVVAPSVLGVEK